MFVGISQCSVINSRWNGLLVLFYCTDFLTLTRSPQVVWISNFARFKDTAATIAATATNSTPWTYTKFHECALHWHLHKIRNSCDEWIRAMQIGAMVENIYMYTFPTTVHIIEIELIRSCIIMFDDMSFVNSAVAAVKRYVSENSLTLASHNNTQQCRKKETTSKTNELCECITE